ncbi:MAG: hypothetical protein H6850_03750 [Alphaproteobacteria bacterium]|nr:MAG: hypothetical protein H6850_03750 [Alphaproteobacteria bacterium]
MFPFLFAQVIEKALVINGQVVSNHDINRIKKLYKALEQVKMPIPDKGNPDLYFYKKMFFEYVIKNNAPWSFLNVSEEEFRNYFQIQLIEFNVSEEDFRKALEENNVSFATFQEFLIDTLRWYRYVGMNFQGFAPSDAAVDEFMKKINASMKGEPSLFITGYIAQVKKGGNAFIDEIQINGMLGAKNKDEFLKIANNYPVQPLEDVPLEAITQPVIKSTVEESYHAKKPVVCDVFDDVTLVIYVTDGYKMKPGISKEQAKHKLFEEVVTKKCGDSFVKQVAKKLKIEDGKNK